jgi:hypothetical protein
VVIGACSICFNAALDFAYRGGWKFSGQFLQLRCLMADGVWRLDSHLGWSVDPDEAKKPVNIVLPVRAPRGDEGEFELE